MAHIDPIGATFHACAQEWEEVCLTKANTLPDGRPHDLRMFRITSAPSSQAVNLSWLLFCMYTKSRWDLSSSGVSKEQHQQRGVSV